MTTPPRSLLNGTLLSLLVVCSVCSPAMPANTSGVNTEQVQFERVDAAIILSSLTANLPPSERIARISSHFLNAPYIANTLIGGPGEPERLVVDLASFDCFTFIDAVEALRRSEVAGEFIPQLTKVRYKNGLVSYLNRRHFFSDWVSTGLDGLADVTALVGQGSAVRVLKRLNKSSGTTLWLDGIPVTERTVAYLPSGKINEVTLLLLQDGDYVGIYTDKAGLDVQHTGIIIKRGGDVLLRHASSSQQKMAVVDDVLTDYLRDKKGLVVYRVRTGK